jgi:hypothetical protein
MVKAKIAQVLGDVDYGMFSDSRFSSGASTSRKRRYGDAYFKYRTTQMCPVDVTPRAFPYARALIMETPAWSESGVHLKVVPGNRISTVPKKTEIDRTIALEPDMNMHLQLAVGGDIRRKLLRVGVNLNDQRHNAALAYIGSVDGSLATIDLSNASDSISYDLIAELLPFDWFSILDDLRSPTGELPDGSTLVWEKFSSMGNGFTFELESLIFWAITVSVVAYEDKFRLPSERIGTKRDAVSVYGDDIICPSTYANSVIAVLSQFGFKTNEEKTFVTGPFRESCGKHYYNGTDVTPFYIRQEVSSLTRMIHFLNRLRAWSYDSDLGLCDPSTWSTWLELSKKYVPRRLRCGKDTDSILCLASPGKARSRLAPVTKRIRLYDGRFVLLRSFQGRGPSTGNNFGWGVPFCQVNWKDINIPVLVDCPPDEISEVQQSVYKIVNNLVYSWQQIPLYSEEY